MTGANQQAMPQLSSRIVDEDGRLNRTWQRLLLSLWKKTGSGYLANVNAAYLEQAPTGAGNPVDIRKASDGSLIGTIPVVNTPGGPAEPQVVGGSPFLFLAPKDGTLVVEAGKVELSRDLGVTYYQVSLVGGACPVLIKDQIQVSWYNDAPKITFFPIAS